MNEPQVMPARATEPTVAMGANATAADVLAVLRGIGCAYCKAQAGRPCHDPRTGLISRVHCTRVTCYRRRARRAAR